MQISPEDRERLAKGKFKEWFDELFSEKFEQSVKEMTAARPRGQQRQEAQQSQGEQQQQQDQPPTKRRSLLETCLSDTFGF
jgi:isocitrate dehydrogenase